MFANCVGFQEVALTLKCEENKGFQGLGGKSSKEHRNMLQRTGHPLGGK